MEIKVDTKQAKREFFRIRGKFLKLQRSIIGEALTASAQPVIHAAAAAAPSLSGRLRQRIGATNPKVFRGRLSVAMGPLRLSRNDKLFPFYGRFQERGWRATGRANRRTAKSPRLIPGKHFLRNAGTQNYSATEQIFSRKLFEGFDAIQSAGEDLGIV